MASSSYVIHVHTNLDCANVDPVTIGYPMQTGDNRAHVISVRLSKNGKSYDPPSGYTVMGYFQTPASSTPYSKSGSISGNVCSVEIPSNVYSKAGEVVGVVRLVATTDGSSASVVTIAKIFAYVTNDVSNSGSQAETKSWTVSQVEGYINRLVTNVNEFEKLKASIEAEIAEFKDTFENQSESYVRNWLNNYFAHADWHLTEADKQQIIQSVSANLNNSATQHINNSTIHVTNSDKANWNDHKNNVTLHVSDSDRRMWNTAWKSTVGSAIEYWDNSKSYKNGDLVLWDNTLWAALIANIGSEPKNANANWGQVSLLSTYADMPFVQSGSTAVTTCSPGTTLISVTFPKAFSSVPNIVICPKWGGTNATNFDKLSFAVASNSADQPTNTGFKIRVGNSQASGDYNTAFTWIAHGKR